MQISYLFGCCFSCSNLLKKAKTATIVANIQLLWELHMQCVITNSMRHNQLTSMPMFISHFALTPEPLVRLSWNFVLRILYMRGRSGVYLSPIRQKNVGRIRRTVLFTKDHLQTKQRRPDYPNSHLQRGRSSGWPTFFWSNEAEIGTRPAHSIKDPKYKISAQTDQRFRS